MRVSFKGSVLKKSTYICSFIINPIMLDAFLRFSEAFSANKLKHRLLCILEKTQRDDESYEIKSV